MIERPRWLLGNVINEPSQIAKERIFNNRSLQTIALLQALHDPLSYLDLGSICAPDADSVEDPRQKHMQPLCLLPITLHKPRTFGTITLPKRTCRIGQNSHSLNRAGGECFWRLPPGRGLSYV
ncbi:hypothetical protein D3C76_492020 [compost metagenome]